MWGGFSVFCILQLNQLLFVQNQAGLWFNNKLFCAGICHCELLESTFSSSVTEN